MLCLYQQSNFVAVRYAGCCATLGADHLLFLRQRPRYCVVERASKIQDNRVQNGCGKFGTGKIKITIVAGYVKSFSGLVSCRESYEGVAHSGTNRGDVEARWRLIAARKS